MGKRYSSTPDVPRINRGVTIFRSCLSCCTGLGYYSDLMPIQTTVGIAARNACVAVDDEHPVMSYLCSTCYAINKKARNILDVPEYRAEPTRSSPSSAVSTTTAWPARCSTSTSSTSCGARTTASPSSFAAASTASR
jgi:hypothetical protein